MVIKCWLLFCLFSSTYLQIHLLPFIVTVAFSYRQHKFRWGIGSDQTVHCLFWVSCINIISVLPFWSKYSLFWDLCLYRHRCLMADAIKYDKVVSRPFISGRRCPMAPMCYWARAPRLTLSHQEKRVEDQVVHSLFSFWVKIQVSDSCPWRLARSAPVSSVPMKRPIE